MKIKSSTPGPAPPSLASRSSSFIKIGGALVLRFGVGLLLILALAAIPAAASAGNDVPDDDDDRNPKTFPQPQQSTVVGLAAFEDLEKAFQAAAMFQEFHRRVEPPPTHHYTLDDFEMTEFGAYNDLFTGADDPNFLPPQPPGRISRTKRALDTSAEQQQQQSQQRGFQQPQQPTVQQPDPRRRPANPPQQSQQFSEPNAGIQQQLPPGYRFGSQSSAFRPPEPKSAQLQQQQFLGQQYNNNAGQQWLPPSGATVGGLGRYKSLRPVLPPMIQADTQKDKVYVPIPSGPDRLPPFQSIQPHKVGSSFVPIIFPLRSEEKEPRYSYAIITDTPEAFAGSDTPVISPEAGAAAVAAYQPPPPPPPPAPTPPQKNIPRQFNNRQQYATPPQLSSPSPRGLPMGPGPFSGQQRPYLPPPRPFYAPNNYGNYGNYGPWNYYPQVPPWQGGPPRGGNYPPGPYQPRVQFSPAYYNYNGGGGGPPPNYVSQSSPPSYYSPRKVQGQPPFLFDQGAWQGPPNYWQAAAAKYVGGGAGFRNWPPNPNLAAPDPRYGGIRSGPFGGGGPPNDFSPGGIGFGYGPNVQRQLSPRQKPRQQSSAKSRSQQQQSANAPWGTSPLERYPSGPPYNNDNNAQVGGGFAAGRGPTIVAPTQQSNFGGRGGGGGQNFPASFKPTGEFINGTLGSGGQYSAAAAPAAAANNTENNRSKQPIFYNPFSQPGPARQPGLPSKPAATQEPEVQRAAPTPSPQTTEATILSGDRRPVSFYSQADVDGHYRRMLAHNETEKDRQFEDDSALLQWDFQRAQQILREHRRAKKPARDSAASGTSGSDSGPNTETTSGGPAQYSQPDRDAGGQPFSNLTVQQPQSQQPGGGGNQPVLQSAGGGPRGLPEFEPPAAAAAANANANGRPAPPSSAGAVFALSPDSSGSDQGGYAAAVPPEPEPPRIPSIYNSKLGPTPTIPHDFANLSTNESISSLVNTKRVRRESLGIDYFVPEFY